MQILEIVLYNNDGSERRILPFNTGKVNIISGKSSTGKSALIEIVDYCLGRGSCYIPRNIRKAISWFGIKLSFENSEVFIARKNPPFKAKTTTEAFIIEGETIESPITAPKEANSNSEDIEELLASKLGINQVKFVPGKNQTREIFQVSLRHALNYSFQPQGIISDKDILFPAVKDNWQRNDLKNTLPYFLGAMNENKINLLNQKEILEKTLRKKTAELQENEKIKGEGFSRGLSLLMECQNIGLIDSNSNLPTNVNEIHDLLSSTLDKKPSFEMELSNSNEINKLFEENESIKDAIKKINNEQEAINFRLGIINSYEEEKEYQTVRLKSIGFYKNLEAKSECPLCSSSLDTKIPSIENIKQSYEDMKNSLGSATASFPNLKKRENDLNKKLVELKENYKTNKQNIIELQKQEEQYEKVKKIEDKYLITIGRISLWLDSLDKLEERDDLKKEIEDLEKEIAKIDKLLDPAKEQAKFDSIISSLNMDMTSLNNNLATDIEHKKDKIGYDPKNTTVTIYDSQENEFFSMNNTGSAQTYLYYHLITLMTFHKHFIMHNRPVPRFLILDQPTQVYFLTEDTNTSEYKNDGEIGDSEREDVVNLFNFIFQFITEQDNNFQIIILEHAKLEEEEFKNSILEEWRGGKALVPQEWMDLEEEIED